MIIEFIECMLEDTYECEIHSVNSYNEFISEVDTSVFDLLITDYNLGDYNGLHILTKFKNAHPIPAIIISGKLPDDVLSFEYNDRLLYIAKPFDFDDLKTAIDECFKKVA